MAHQSKRIMVTTFYTRIFGVGNNSVNPDLKTKTMFCVSTIIQIIPDLKLKPFFFSDHLKPKFSCKYCSLNAKCPPRIYATTKFSSTVYFSHIILIFNIFLYRLLFVFCTLFTQLTHLLIHNHKFWVIRYFQRKRRLFMWEYSLEQQTKALWLLMSIFVN